jgi:hypothetical protein
MENKMTRSAEPEQEILRRILPFGPLAMVVALVVGRMASDWNVGVSAAIGVAVVYVNSLVHGLSLSWAAKVSLTALYGVGLGGFVVRLGAILALLFGLSRTAFFSPHAFLAAVVPATVVLLAYEMSLLGGVLGRGLPAATDGPVKS